MQAIMEEGGEASILETYLLTALKQGPNCGILNKRSITQLFPVKHSKHVIRTGSIADGTGHAAYGLWQVDHDFMHEVFHIPPEEKSRIHYLSSKSGFVWIGFKEEESEFEVVEKDGNHYLSARSIRNISEVSFELTETEFGGKIKHKQAKPSGAANEFLIDLGANIPSEQYLERIDNPREPEVITFSPGSFPVPKQNEQNFLLHFDYVQAVYCEFFPEQANKWIERANILFEGKAEVLIDILSSGFHLVPKTYLGGDEELDFRISFSVVEDKLIRNWNDNQWLCYLILKFLFKLCLEEIKSTISTYHLKTAMLWACEQKHKSFWEVTNMSVCVTGVLKELMHCMGEKSLPHYFIPELNLLESVPHDCLTKVVGAVNKLVNKIEEAVKGNQGNHWLCYIFKGKCIHPNDWMELDKAEELTFNSLRFAHQILIRDIKKAAVSTVKLLNDSEITEEEYNSREKLMNLCICILKVKSDFADQVTSMTNFLINAPLPDDVQDADAFLLSAPEGNIPPAGMSDMIQPQLLVENMSKLFKLTAPMPSDPFLWLSEIIPDPKRIIEEHFASHEWKVLSEMKNYDNFIPFPKSLASLSGRDQLAWNYLRETGKQSRMQLGTEDVKPPENLSAAIVMEHVFCGYLGQNKDQEQKVQGIRYLKNIPNIGGADIQSIVTTLEGYLSKEGAKITQESENA